MRIETLCTGDELLTGLTSDTNSRFFQERLLEVAGLTVHRGTVVGDHRIELTAALDEVTQRADVVLVSGGLGPTTDDLTAECAAAAAKVPLVQSHAALMHLEARFKVRGITLTENNKRQALVPAGSEVVLNAEGSAPMFIQRRGKTTLFFVPGVPREYRHLVAHCVVPRIAAMAGSKDVRRLALLKTVGIPESHLDERVRPLATQFPSIEIGFRTHAPENHLKLMAVGADAALAAALLEEAVAAARAILGDAVFGLDDETMPGVVVKALKARGHRVVLAESCTGGRVSSELTSIPGASEVYFGGACTYADAAKSLWAQVPPELIQQHGAVSAQVAEAMASGVRAAAGVEWALSTTGYAGPGGSDDANETGTVYLALAGPSGVKHERKRFAGDRERVISFASAAALDLLRRELQGSSS